MEVYNKLQEAFPGEVIFDDRWHLQFGGKLSDLKTCGFPFLIILGNKVCYTKLNEVPKNLIIFFDTGR